MWLNMLHAIPIHTNIITCIHCSHLIDCNYLLLLATRIQRLPSLHSFSYIVFSRSEFLQISDSYTGQTPLWRDPNQKHSSLHSYTISRLYYLSSALFLKIFSKIFSKFFLKVCTVSQKNKKNKKIKIHFFL